LSVDIAGIIEGIARFIKVIFGMDKPGRVTVEKPKTPDVLRPSDSDVRADLGMHDRPEGS